MQKKKKKVQKKRVSQKKDAQKKEEVGKIRFFNKILMGFIVFLTLLLIISNLDIIFPKSVESNTSSLIITRDQTNENPNENNTDETGQRERIEEENASEDDTLTSEEESNKEPKKESDENEQDNNNTAAAQETRVPDSDNTTTITLFFISVGEDETITPVAYTRDIPRTSSILTQSINTLIKGPSSEEQDHGASHFIPPNSVLNRASVSHNIAFLDFNDAFRYNELGSAGILAQLYQVVQTATSIPRINSVQITINNETIKFLGGEGKIEINKPIDVSYLRQF